MNDTERKKLLEKALAARRESKAIDFKESIHFDTDPGAWCECIKDIVAMMNSGGGAIVFGVFNNGKPSGWAPDAVLALDPAKITDQIAKYTGDQADDFEIVEGKRGRARVAVLLVAAVTDAPLVFNRVGTYVVSPPGAPQQQKTAFSKGTVYFRHGAKSEPATRNDLEIFIQRQLERIRAGWMGNIKKVVSGPPGASMVLVTRSDAEGRPMSIRLTDDPAAPEFRAVAPDETHPYRQTETLERLHSALPKANITSFKLQCVVKVFEIKAKRQFCIQPKYSTPQYSDSFIDWVIAETKKDADFFDKAVERCRHAQKPV